MSTNAEQRLQQQVDELMIRLAASEEARKKAEENAFSWRSQYYELYAKSEELVKGTIRQSTLICELTCRAEAAEQRIKASQEQEPSVEAYAYVSKDMCKVTVTNLRFIGDVKSAPYGTKFYKQPPIPPELSEVVRERDELRRKLAEQQSHSNFDAARLRRLVSFCGVAAPESDEELLQVAGVVIGSCLRNLTKLIEEAKRQTVPEGWIPVEDRFPPKNSNCLVCGRNNVYYAFYDGSWYVENRGMIGSVGDIEKSFWMRPSKDTPVLFWMPLPAAPQIRTKSC